MDTKFYSDAANYWESVPATLDGVLGGFESISDIDIKGSKKFLEDLLLNLPKDSKLQSRKPPNINLALDCGAGIGRISKFLLTKYFKCVDLVEQNAKFLEEAKSYIDKKERIGDMYNVGLQDFIPEKKYDVIWSQWVLGHLTDDDLVNFFITCRNALNENGIIVVKENVTTSNKLEKDDVDSSVTRPLDSLISIFKKAKLKMIKQCKQTDFPKGIYPVYIFALRPKMSSDKNKIQPKDYQNEIETELGNVEIKNS